MKTEDLRKKFLDFFRERRHTIVSSDSLVPDDPSVLFTPAGMNQFKPYFLGEKKNFSRAASCQKCLRTGDLERVGQTPYHHTFFEMLGNFSFGDYFKKEAIAFAWEFLCKHLNIKEEDLWISVYKDDQEAYRIWKDYIGVAKEKIVMLEEDSNFWPACAPRLGPNGPCGPCSEIFFDKGKTKGCKGVKCGPSCDCGRFVEVWNLVFTQFNRVGENKLDLLPQKNIDTGMGLERMAAVLQEKDSNFEIDILAPLVKYAEDLAGIKRKGKEEISLINAIVDHARAATFAISDGVYPSNEERGYVIRKLIRKAVWKGNFLGWKKPFLYKLPAVCADILKEQYPQVYEKKENISQIVLAEEEKFLYTLTEGRNQFSIIVEELKKKGAETVSAEDCFLLYDTYGFPLELSKEIACEYNFKVDDSGFSLLLEKQKRRSRENSTLGAGIFVMKDKLSLSEVSRFKGYQLLQGEDLILQLIKNNERCDVLNEGEQGLIILDSTPFYPESGGQLADKGFIKTKEGQFQVEEVFKINEAIAHKGKVVKGKITKGISFSSVDSMRRNALMRAHTATHLLQAALRQVLGQHVMQQGSLVEEDKLRFDFTHFKGLAEQELRKVEKVVNECILRADIIEKRVISYEEAKNEGALAFFKDKYSASVRVVSISDYSKELCAGTHLDNTSQAVCFSIISESSISSGVRRIEALAGKAAFDYLADARNNLEDLEKILKCKYKGLKNSVGKLIEDLKKEKEKNVNLEKKIVSLQINDILAAKKEINGKNFLIYTFSQKDFSILLYVLDVLKKKINYGFGFFVSTDEGNNIFICSVSPDLQAAGGSCKKFISAFGKKLSLKGGGRDDLAQGVILKKNGDFLQKVEECVKEFLNQ